MRPMDGTVNTTGSGSGGLTGWYKTGTKPIHSAHACGIASFSRNMGWIPKEGVQVYEITNHSGTTFHVLTNYSHPTYDVTVIVYILGLETI